MRTDPFLIIEHGGGCCNPSAEDEQGGEVPGFQSHSLAETGFSLVIESMSQNSRWGIMEEGTWN